MRKSDVMPSEVLSSCDSVKPDARMVVSSEVKRTSPLASKMVDERFPLPQAKRNLKSQDKCKAKSIRSQLYVGLHHAPRQNVDSQLKCLEDMEKLRIENKVVKDDELVKHMPTLPACVKHFENKEKLEEKVLNFEVLNRENLEKWQYSPKGISERANTGSTPKKSNSSSKVSSMTCSFVHVETVAHQSKQQRSLCSDIESYSKVDHPQGQSSQEKVIFLQVMKSPYHGASHMQKKAPCPDKSLSKNYRNSHLVKGKEKDFDPKIIPQIGTSSVELKRREISINLQEKTSPGVAKTNYRVEKVQKSEITMKVSDTRTNSLSNLRSNERSTLPESTTISDCETEMREQNPQKSNRQLSHQACPETPENIALGLARSTTRELKFMKPQKSADKNFSVTNKNGIPGGLSRKKVHSSELNSKIMYSSRLPGSVEINPKEVINPHKRTSAKGMELPYLESQPFQSSSEMPIVPAKGGCAEGRKLITKHTDLTVNEGCRKLDQEPLECQSTKSRTPSPNRRFSFSLGRMSRSLSFKDSSDVPPLRSSDVSASSSSVHSEASSGSDNTYRDNEIIMNRARSSPLRRLLDPLLKPKAASSPRCSSERDRPSKVEINSLSLIPITASESLDNENHKASTVQALLQITIKNGLPLFKFVVENSSNVLMGTMTKVTSSGKNSSSQTYTLYSVNEIKKKSGSWMSQGTKDKNCGYVYNIAGQMRISSSCSEIMTKANSNKRLTTRESTLFGVELRESKQETPKLMPNRELATIVVKIPNEDLRNYEDQTKEDEHCLKGSTDNLPKDRCFRNLVESDSSFMTTVILPDGVHGLPDKGEPSTLLDRWRSGGLCDCGGWDVGCKLCVLSNQNHCCKLSERSKARPISHRFELFAQGSQASKPMFSLGPFEKGIYSVEFKSSISLLQAFFICIAVLSRPNISLSSKETCN